MKSCWYRGERIPRKPILLYFNKEGGQLLQFEEAPQFGKNAYINTRYKEKLAITSNQSRLVGERQRKVFQNYQNKTVKEQKMRKKRILKV